MMDSHILLEDSHGGDKSMFSFSAGEIELTLEQIFQSIPFRQARSMCRLLHYLIKRILSDGQCAINEYMIALEVLGCNPSTYDPKVDPVVRVQMGRLRKRLHQYYTSLDEESVPCSLLLISIPTGHYRPVIQRRKYRYCEKLAMSFAKPSSMILLPLHSISEDMSGRVLTKKLNMQMLEEAPKVFGETLCVPSMPLVGTTSATVLEGSTRIDAEQLQINVRLVDQNSDRILFWKSMSLGLDVKSEGLVLVSQELFHEVCKMLIFFGSQPRAINSVSR